MDTTHFWPRPVVHLELHTPDLSAAGAFYATLVRWRQELIDTQCGSYLALELGGGYRRMPHETAALASLR